MDPETPDESDARLDAEAAVVVSIGPVTTLVAVPGAATPPVATSLESALPATQSSDTAVPAVRSGTQRPFRPAQEPGRCVAASSLITNKDEAQDYYREKIAGTRRLIVRGEEIRVEFYWELTHCYSEDIRPAGAKVPGNLLVRRRFPDGSDERRRFMPDRALEMDQIFGAISNHVVVEDGRDWRYLIYGPALPSGQHLRVTLRGGGGHRKYVCLSSCPVDAGVVDQALKVPIPFPG